MKKKNRHTKSSGTSQQTSRKQTTASVGEETKTSGNRDRPEKSGHATSFYHDQAATEKNPNSDFSVTAADNTQKHKSSGKWLRTNLLN